MDDDGFRITLDWCQLNNSFEDTKGAIRIHKSKKDMQCTHKLYIQTFIQFVIASAPFTHAWTHEKKRLIL